MLRLALFQPDIPQNAGTMIRMAACLGLTVDIIEPAAFDVSDRHFRRSGMDYLERAAVSRHDSFRAFDDWRRAAGRRLVLAETDGPIALPDFAFQADDVVMVGRESAGVTPEVRSAAEAVICIPMRPGLRSINVALAAAMVMGEALRQTGGFPGRDETDDADAPPHR
ncbi:MAG: tRNA methyltransferase [Bosea sp.]|uniref:tRNA (cytidine(34)-2'-O)-methyltransferase n=1 Tax=unclassified Bosea (in: a-proteobacteria) TaxID=2653178 RepID=UPI0009675C28|nr:MULTISPECIES: TrmH family RNA methyltransferase [unclassified Bosea (in: a-proteobacteria)]MBN9455871.1 tRNA methyltransferase [Bosea sp. (in: a-proteobacteria)]OJV05959.1 MAG: tRNA methyltransferase [Bosea sp. 67-29]